MESISVIDLGFSTRQMHPSVVDWQICDEWHTGSDHEVIYFALITSNTQMVDNPLRAAPYNLKKADWEKFGEILRRNTVTMSQLDFDSMTNEELE